MEQWNLSPRRIIRVLYWLRNISVSLQLTFVLLVTLWAQSFSGFWLLLISILALAVFNLAVLWRLNKDWPETEAEVAAHLIFDVLQFTALMYFTGGAANPFVSLYLLPVALTSACLRIHFAVIIALFCTLAYSLLLLAHHPDHISTHDLSTQFGSNFNLHIWGMWVNFILAAALLILFVGMLAKLVKGHEREIAEVRERTLRDEGILAVGTLAAGAAHQLGTPLSTMKILLEDWNEQKDIQQEDIAIMSQQVNACRDILNQMLRYVRDSKGEVGHVLSVQDFVDDCIERWRVTRPEIQIEEQKPTALQSQLLQERAIRYDVTFAQALTNLLNNAADASMANDDTQIAVETWLSDDMLHCRIRDRGLGLSREQSAVAAHMFRSSKTNGMGIGLALSNSTIERLQGHVNFYHDSNGGTTWIKIPLTSLLPISD